MNILDPQAFSLFLTWMHLPPAQQDQFHLAVGSYRDLTDNDRAALLQNIKNIVASVDLGPLRTPCPRCGR